MEIMIVMLIIINIQMMVIITIIIIIIIILLIGNYSVQLIIGEVSNVYKWFCKTFANNLLEFLSTL